MAYGLSQRFPRPPERFTLLEPGAYQYKNSPIIEPNKVGFLSKTERKTLEANPVWTHAIYYADHPPKVPNCSSISSKIPRFPYEAFSAKDLETILCQCGIENPCKCPVEGHESETKENVVCQGLVPRRIYKGTTMKSLLGDGLGAPSKRDYGFKILPDGTKIRIFKKPPDDSPPFYNTNVVESSAFYRGWKWSKWTSQRDNKLIEDKPGPANYFIEKVPSFDSMCAEKVRAYKRKTSKQYRFIEMVQRKNIIEGFPGPANYSPNPPKGSDLKRLGSIAKRFQISKYQDQPGPTAYSIKRDFDLVEIPTKLCHAKLPPPAFFGVKAIRFKPLKEEGPSAASYDASYRPCQIQHCNVAAFGSSSKRFKATITEEDEEDFLIEELMQEFEISQNNVKPKTNPTWEFRSKTIRMKPLTKQLNEPSPADLPQTILKKNRLLQTQITSPFNSSERRLKPWFNWIPVHGKENTPGPAYYCLEKPKCLPAVSRGPLNRSARFPFVSFKSPAPNEYVVKRGIEDILATHNQRLKENMQNQHKFHWKPPVEKSKLSLVEQENTLLQKSIALLDVAETSGEGKYEKKICSQEEETKKSKLLRCFLFPKQIRNCY